MKILRYVFYFLLLICLSTGVQAAKKIATLYIPAGSMGVLTGFQFNLSILTPEGAQYGVYQSRSVAILNVPLVSWTGQGTAPELHLEDARTILPTSRCPGLEEYDARTPQTTWACVEMKVTVFYDHTITHFVIKRKARPRVLCPRSHVVNLQHFRGSGISFKSAIFNTHILRAI